MLVKFKENRVRRAYFGGKRIDCFYGKLGENTRYPEEWLASTTEAFNPDMPKAGEGVSETEGGENFRELLEKNGIELLGERCYALDGGKASVLVKLLDSAERLVIQCHPTAEFAAARMNSQFGKTECWYILDADDGACVYLGFKEGITRDRWERLFEEQNVDGMLASLHKFPVKPGELWFVDGGVPHAIGGGSLMIELQEPSDLMVIPERVTPSGVTLAEKKLHGGLGFDGMFDVFTYEGFSEDEIRKRYFRETPRKENEPVTVVGSDLTDKFSMSRITVRKEADFNLKDRYAVAIVTNGTGALICDGETVSVKKGDSLFIGADSDRILLKGNFEIVLCVSH